MTDGLHVCHVTTVPMSLMFLRGQTAFMKRRGIRLSFVSSPGEELRAFGERERANTHAVEMTRRITPLRDLQALLELWSYFRVTRPDIVHAHTPKGGLLGTLAAFLSGVPARIYHVRGLPLEGAEGWKRALLTATERLACGVATRVFSNSASLSRELVRHGIVAARRIEVPGPGSGQGVDTAHFSSSRVDPAQRRALRRDLGIDDGAFVVGFVGRLVRQKGIGELETAWRRISRQHPDARLVLVGPFEEERDSVPSETRDRLVASRSVRLVGRVGDTRPYYAIMDLLTLPTYREGFPNVLLEAAAMGLPVVATRVTGCVDAVEHGVTGTLVPPADPSALVEAIGAYARDGSLRSSHGDAARLAVRRFERERVWEALAVAYEGMAPPSAATGV